MRPPQFCDRSQNWKTPIKQHFIQPSLPNPNILGQPRNHLVPIIRPLLVRQKMRVQNSPNLLISNHFLPFDSLPSPFLSFFQNAHNSISESGIGIARSYSCPASRSYGNTQRARAQSRTGRGGVRERHPGLTSPLLLRQQTFYLSQCISPAHLRAGSRRSAHIGSASSLRTAGARVPPGSPS